MTLLCDDVDLDNGVITIRNGKNNVSRLVPISDSLREYLFYYDGRVQRDTGATLIFFRLSVASIILTLQLEHL